MDNLPESKRIIYVMPMRQATIVPVKVPKIRTETPQRRPVDLYSWWQHQDSDSPVCVVDKLSRGQGIDFRITHVKLLRIQESNPTIVAIERFWKLVADGKIKEVTLPIEVTLSLT